MSTANFLKRRLIYCQFLIVAFLIISCSKEQAPTFIIGAGSVEGSYWKTSLALRRILVDDPATSGFRFDQEASSGSVSNIDAIAAGDIQFGIVQADDQYQAVMGLEEWEGKGPQEELRAVFSLYVESVTLVAGADTDIRSVEDLKAKRVDIGAPGSGTRRNAIDGLRAGGVDWKNDIEAYEESLEDRLAKFMRGEIDAFFYTAGHPNKEIKFATVSVRGARIIPLVNLDSLIESTPFYFKTLIPSETYPKAENDIDIATIGVNATLLTSSRVSEEVVYAITKAVFENVEASTSFQPEFGALLSNHFLDGLTAPIHPGALKYYREIGVSIP
jgi:TRAP transporter TAXI family solute receptor